MSIKKKIKWIVTAMDGYDVLVFERNRLTELKSRLFTQERAMKDERRKLWQSEKESEQECQVWSELELLSTYIFGYVSQITTKDDMIEKPHEVINHLHKLSIFDVECIMKWYPSAAQEYPKIKEFFELLDYLRLLVIEYIERYGYKN